MSRSYTKIGINGGCDARGHPINPQSTRGEYFRYKSYAAINRLLTSTGNWQSLNVHKADFDAEVTALFRNAAFVGDKSAAKQLKLRCTTRKTETRVTTKLQNHVQIG